MVDPDHNNWFGYLVYTFVKEVVEQSMECCVGCIDAKISPLLHSHQQSGLLEKLLLYFPIVRDLLFSKLPVLVDDYVDKFPDLEIYDDAGKRTLKSLGREFLNNCDPRSLYYSKNLSPDLDELLSLTGTVDLRMKPMNMKRVARNLAKDRSKTKKQKLDNDVVLLD